MKLSTLIVFSSTVVAVLFLATFLIATDRDPALLLTILVAAIPALGAVYGLNQLSKTTRTIETQTNGTNTALRLENSGLRRENGILRSHLPVDVAVNIATTPIATAEVELSEVTADE